MSRVDNQQDKVSLEARHAKEEAELTDRRRSRRTTTVNTRRAR
jgi:hypothetical protein